MGHKNNGLSTGFPDALDVPVELLAGEGIERGKGFVHEQHTGIGSQRAGQSNALLHAARKLVNVRVQNMGKANEIEVILCHFLAFLVVQSGLEAKTEQHIAEHIQPWEKRVFLEHHHAVTARSGHALSIRQHAAAIGRVESSDDIEKSGFSASAWSDEAEEFALGDLHAHVVESHNGPSVGSEGFCDAIDFDALGSYIDKGVFDAHGFQIKS